MRSQIISTFVPNMVKLACLGKVQVVLCYNPSTRWLPLYLDSKSDMKPAGFCIEAEMKQCCECRGFKTYEEMTKDNRKSDGMGYVCLKCKQIRKKQLHALNPEVNRVHGRRNYALHKEVTKVKSRKYYHDNRAEIRQKDREKYAANPQKYIADVMRWKIAHPEKRLEQGRIRRARKLNNGGRITAQEWQALKEFYGFTCLRCGKQEPEIKLTLDHVVPLKKGGSHTIDNAQPLCQSCNSKKNVSTVDYRKAMP